MIRFDLTCANNHSFDSWFRSGEDCDSLLGKALVSCTTCGDTQIRKALMTPKVSTSDKTTITPPQLRPDPDTAPLAKLKSHVEANATDVGANFATEARAMHSGEKPEQAIYGQASGAEAKKLISEGVPVLPLPFIPTKKNKLGPLNQHRHCAQDPSRDTDGAGPQMIQQGVARRTRPTKGAPPFQHCTKGGTDWRYAMSADLTRPPQTRGPQLLWFFPNPRRRQQHRGPYPARLQTAPHQSQSHQKHVMRPQGRTSRSGQLHIAHPVHAV